MHTANSFITLTYNDRHLPKDLSLNVKDWQDFAKRLRKKIGPFRYFHAGEYGDDKNRPHYHAAIFGFDFPDKKYFKQGSRGDSLYSSELLSEVWQKGFVSVGSLTPASARYISKYVTKRKTGPEAEEEYSRVNVLTGEVFKVAPCYATMSRRPGLGRKFYEKYGAALRRNGRVPFGDGKYAAMPKYYDLLHAEVDPEGLKAVKIARESRIDVDEQRGARLATRERCAEAARKEKRRVF